MKLITSSNSTPDSAARLHTPNEDKCSLSKASTDSPVATQSLFHGRDVHFTTTRKRKLSLFSGSNSKLKLHIKKTKRDSDVQDYGGSIKRKIQALVNRRITFQEYSNWYTVAFRVMKAEMQLHQTFTEIHTTFKNIASSSKSIEEKTAEFKKTVPALIAEVDSHRLRLKEEGETHLIESNNPLKTPEISTPATMLHKRLILSSPVHNTLTHFDPNRPTINTIKDLYEQDREITALFQSAEKQQLLTSFLEQMTKLCQAQIHSRGRKVISPKEFTCDIMTDHFYSACPINSNDIELLKKLKKLKIETQYSKIINDLKIVVCRSYISNSFQSASMANELIRGNDARVEEARQARLQYLNSDDAIDFKDVTRILGRPAGLREDLGDLVEQLPKIRDNPIPCTGKTIKPQQTVNTIEKLLKLITKLLKDEDKKKDLVAVNQLVLDIHKKLQSDMCLYDQFKKWPHRYPLVMTGKTSQPAVTTD